MNKEQVEKTIQTKIKKKGSVGDNAPHLVKEWDYDKNGGKTPYDYTAGSNQKVWWICPRCGNSYLTRINLRYRGHGCALCSKDKRKATILERSENALELFPELIKEWDTVKNTGSLAEISKGSQKKVWWKCRNGHSWQATVATRAKGHGCPFCSGRYPTKEDNLATKAPGLIKEWHPIKNGDLTPEMVKPYSSRKVWWICERGHEWQASISNRYQGRGCAQCSTELKSSFPEQAIFYYLSPFYKVNSREKIGGWEVDIYLPEHNIGIEYDGIAYHSKDYLVEREGRKTQALQENGVDLIRIKENYEQEGIDNQIVRFIVSHDYKNFPKALRMLFELLEEKTGIHIDNNVDIERDRVSILAQYTQIEKKASFAEKYPDLVSLWNYEKNEGLKPESFRYMSNRKLWWKCPVCTGQWEESIINVAKGNRCPYCSGHRVLAGFNDLQTVAPHIAAEWDYEKNEHLKPTDVSVGSGKVIWWKCVEGHSWRAAVANRQVVKGCPYCSGRHKEIPLDDTSWMNKYSAAKLYFEEHGNLEVPAKYVNADGMKLGMWIRTQRATQKNGILAPHRKKLLDEIGMVWNLRPGVKKS